MRKDSEPYEGYRAKSHEVTQDSSGVTNLTRYQTASMSDRPEAPSGAYQGFTASGNYQSKNPIIALYVKTIVRAQFLTDKDFKKGK